MRFIHWEYNDYGTGTFNDSSLLDMRAFPLREIGTTEKTGFTLRWTVRIYILEDEPPLLSCIAESDHTHVLDKLSSEDFIKEVDSSYKSFMDLLNERMKSTNLIVYLTHQLQPQAADQILLRLCQER
jgi:hypothetical protein